MWKKLLLSVLSVIIFDDVFKFFNCKPNCIKLKFLFQIFNLKRFLLSTAASTSVWWLLFSVFLTCIKFVWRRFLQWCVYQTNQNYAETVQSCNLTFKCISKHKHFNSSVVYNFFYFFVYYITAVAVLLETYLVFFVSCNRYINIFYVVTFSGQTKQNAIIIIIYNYFLSGVNYCRNSNNNKAIISVLLKFLLKRRASRCPTKEYF